MAVTIDARANAGLESWKRTTLQDAISAAASAADALRTNGVTVPPAYAPVAVAQFLLESAWGKSDAGGARNYFGIKAVDGQPFVERPTWEHVNGKDVQLVQRFRRFGSMAECFLAHAKLLCTRPQYAPARAHGNDPIAFARALQGVYATDPHYADKLAAVLRDRGLLTSFGFAPPAA